MTNNTTPIANRLDIYTATQPLGYSKIDSDLYRFLPDDYDFNVYDWLENMERQAVLTENL